MILSLQINQWLVPNLMIFFIGIGPLLAREVKPQSVSPLSYLGQSSLNSIYLHEVTLEEIIKILHSLKNGAVGYDGIAAIIVKVLCSSIVNPLICIYICNICLAQGVFPNELKIGNVLPLYKADDPLCFNNDRPVSLLCVLSKVFEKLCMTDCIMFSRSIIFL